MLALIGRRCWAVLVTVVLLGCASSGAATDTDPERLPSGAAGMMSEAGCHLGWACPCANRTQGYYSQCEPVESCECGNCPVFEPEGPPQFQACGGAVSGDWVLESAVFRTTAAPFLTQAGVKLGECPAQLVGAPQDFKLRLSVPPGAPAQVDTSGLEFEVRFLDSCIRPFVGSCSSGVTYYDRPCTFLGCDVCECPRKVFSPVFGASHLQFDQSTLMLQAGRGSAVQFQYCLAGERLTLSTEGLTAELRQVAFAGTPAACEGRTAADCELGGPTGGCRWLSDGCSGNAPSTCQLQDFGVVPGCTVYQAGATCSPVAAPKNCGDLSEADCGATSGCEWQASCTGPAIGCDALWLRSGICDTEGGCEKASAEICTGTAECAKHATQVHCTELNQCSWGGQCVVAEDPPCNAYPVADCARHDRCQIVGKRANLTR